MGNSYDQLRAAELMAKCSGSLSILGSLSIIGHILNKGRARRTTLLRILLGMSVFDIGASSMYVVGSWAIPSDTDDVVFQPSGNDRTCHAQAFLFQTFASAIPMYNLSVAIYSYLAVNHSWREEKMKKYAWCFHILPVLFGTTTATYGLVHDQFNNNELWCWFSGTEHSDMLKFVVYYGPLWVVFGIIVCLFTLIYRFVRQQEEANERYHFDLILANANQSTHSVKSIGSQQQRQAQQQRNEPQQRNGSSESQLQPPPPPLAHDSEGVCSPGGGGGGGVGDGPQCPSPLVPQLRRSQRMWSSFQAKCFRTVPSVREGRLSRAVFIQGLLFSTVFVLTFLFPTIVRSQQLHKENIRFGTLFLMTLFLPLQGFLNALVYFKTQIHKFCKRRGIFSKFSLFSLLHFSSTQPARRSVISSRGSRKFSCISRPVGDGSGSSHFYSRYYNHQHQQTNRYDGGDSCQDFPGGRRPPSHNSNSNNNNNMGGVVFVVQDDSSNSSSNHNIGNSSPPTNYPRHFDYLSLSPPPPVLGVVLSSDEDDEVDDNVRVNLEAQHEQQQQLQDQNVVEEPKGPDSSELEEEQHKNNDNNSIDMVSLMPQMLREKLDESNHHYKEELEAAADAARR